MLRRARFEDQTRVFAETFPRTENSSANAFNFWIKSVHNCRHRTPLSFQSENLYIFSDVPVKILYRKIPRWLEDDIASDEGMAISLCEFSWWPLWCEDDIEDDDSGDDGLDFVIKSRRKWNFGFASMSIQWQVGHLGLFIVYVATPRVEH